MLEGFARRRVHHDERGDGGKQHDAGGLGCRMGEFDDLEVARLMTADFFDEQGLVAVPALAGGCVLIVGDVLVFLGHSLYSFLFGRMALLSRFVFVRANARRFGSS